MVYQRQNKDSNTRFLGGRWKQGLTWAALESFWTESKLLFMTIHYYGG